MTATYVITFHVRPGERERFLSLLNLVLDRMRHEVNFRSATLNEDPDDAHRFLLHETWADHQDVIEVQIHRDYRRDWHAALDSLLARPRDISIWRLLRADHSA